jgi:hypothetical protein
VVATPSRADAPGTLVEMLARAPRFQNPLMRLPYARRKADGRIRKAVLERADGVLLANVEVDRLRKSLA